MRSMPRLGVDTLPTPRWAAQILVSIALTALAVTTGGCVSLVQYNNLTSSVEAVQAVCTGQEPDGYDGYGESLHVQRDEVRGVLVVSGGRNRSLERPLEAYWTPSLCGETDTDEDDIVCVNGKMRRWPVLAKAAHDKLLPRDCDRPRGGDRS